MRLNPPTVLLLSLRCFIPMTTRPVSSLLRESLGSTHVSGLTVGKELRLKQQYFWTAASLADILRRFKNLGKLITELSDCESLGNMILRWLNNPQMLLYSSTTSVSYV